MVARSVTALAWQAPRPLCAAVGVDRQASAHAEHKASQALSLAGPWQRLRGYWLAPVNITGCYAQVWPVVRGAHLVSTPLRALRVGITPVMSCAPPPLHAAPACSSCRAEYQSMRWPWLRHRRKRPQPGAARSLEGWPRPTAIRPRGAPQPHATTEKTYLHWPDSVAPCSPRQGFAAPRCARP